MQRANIHDRGSIEKIYPRAVFEREAQINTRAKATLLNGVRIQSAPDALGAFELTRASRHVGEAETSGGSIFLCPFAREAAFVERRDGYGAVDERQDAPADMGDEYESFIDKIIATARTAHFERAPGRGDPRLRGLRQ